jgi:uncharacterized RDD family membrane protein YckC
MSEMSQPPASVADGPSGPRAGFGHRLLAFLIDLILLSVVQGIIWAVANPGVAYGVGTLLSLAYYTYFEGSESGQTVGKRALGIRVIDFRGGGSIGYGRAFIRWISRILSSIPCLLGYFWMLWDREKQTWHDKLATSVVVPTSSYPVDSWPG